MTGYACLIAALLINADAAAPDFDTEIVPVLTKAGCNSGACHGAASGQGGFRLSLWGSDPAADYEHIVRALEGRRVNLVRPDESLLLAKPTGYLDHGGGVRLDESGQGAKRLYDWLAAGAPRQQLRQLAKLEVHPASAVLNRPGDAQPLRVSAHHSDGLVQDVTPWAVLAPHDAAAVEIDGQGVATVRRAGRHVVVVRYLNQVVAVTLAVPLSAGAVDLSREPRHDFVDEAILAELETLRLKPAPPAGDETFLRRVRLDLTGTLPSAEQRRQFLADTGPNRRGRLIDRLLASPEFVDYWTHFLARLLRVDSAGMDAEGAAAFRAWLREQVADGTPWNEMARTMLTADGDSHSWGPANFARATPSARDQAELVSQALMGLRLRCANCHNHPLDRWTQDDYHGLAAVFARLQRGRQVALSRRGEVIHPRSGEAARPKLPGQRFLSAAQDGRAALADWLTAPENPYFARALVNRLWHAMFGRGLVEPLDDLRETNPASHPTLLDQLAEDFVAHGYNVRHTLRLLATSATYGRSAGITENDEAGNAFYATARVRPLQPEVLVDALSDVTGVAEQFAHAPLGTRAMNLVDARVPSEALDLLGRCGGGAPCQSSARGGMAGQLHLINGALINQRVAAPHGRLHTLLAEGRAPTEIVAEFYERALTRSPRDDERVFWSEQFAARTDELERQHVLEDFLWGLLNCQEFVTNH